MTHTNQQNAYIDIDGVLLGKRGNSIVLAEGAEALVEYLLAHYNCYWLTTHCKGDTAVPMAYLVPYTDEALRVKLSRVQPTTFDVLKTDAIDFDHEFIWVDDSPLATEVQLLRDQGRLDSWKQVNTYKDPQGLVQLLAELQMSGG
jgi:hypothetical protein